MPNQYWIPKYKWQLVGWLTSHFPEDEKKLKKMAKKQLYATYISIRKELGR